MPDRAWWSLQQPGELLRRARLMLDQLQDANPQRSAQRLILLRAADRQARRQVRHRRWTAASVVLIHAYRASSSLRLIHRTNFTTRSILLIQKFSSASHRRRHLRSVCAILGNASLAQKCLAVKERPHWQEHR